MMLLLNLQIYLAALSFLFSTSIGYTAPTAFTATSRRSGIRLHAESSTSSVPSINAASNNDSEEISWDKVTDEWELDCYSRPVVVEGRKKLWEVLVTDSSGSMRVCRPLPSNK